VDPAILVVAALPVIAVTAFLGGVTRDHPRHRLALGIAAALSALWIAFLILQVVVSA